MEITPKERSTALLAHILGLLGFIGPLIVFLITDEKEQPFGKDQAKEALNFQLFCLVLYIASSILMTILIGFLTFALVTVFWLVFTIVASVKANQGEDYRYPFTIRFLK